MLLYFVSERCKKCSILEVLKELNLHGNIIHIHQSFSVLICQMLFHPWFFKYAKVIVDRNSREILSD